MQTKRTNLEILNPRGKTIVQSQSIVVNHLESMSGKKIGVLDNNKPGGKMLFPYVKESLKRRFPDTEIRTWSVPLDLSPELKAERIKEIVQYSDGVIALLGD